MKRIVCMILAVTFLISMSSCLGWKYRHKTKTYTMMTDQSDYHKQAYADIQKRVEVVKAEGASEVDQLRMECETYDEYISKAPSSKYHTSAVEVLEKDKKTACRKLSRAEKQEQRQIEREEAIAERELRQEEQRLQNEEAKRIRESPEGIKDDACKTKWRIKEAQSVIDREKRIAKNAMGVVNMERLYSIGAAIEEEKQNLRELKKKYKKLTGKRLRLSDCPKDETIRGIYYDYN